MKLLLVFVMVTSDGRKREKRRQPTQGVEMTVRGMSAVDSPSCLVALLVVTLAALQMSSLADLVVDSAS